MIYFVLLLIVAGFLLCTFAPNFSGGDSEGRIGLTILGFLLFAVGLWGFYTVSSELGYIGTDSLKAGVIYENITSQKEISKDDQSIIIVARNFKDGTIKTYKKHTENPNIPKYFTVDKKYEIKEVSMKDVINK